MSLDYTSKVRTFVASFVPTEYKIILLLTQQISPGFSPWNGIRNYGAFMNNTLPFSLRFSGSVKTKRCVQRKRNGNFYLGATVRHCSVDKFFGVSSL